MTPGAAVQSALELRRAGRPDDAERTLRQALEDAPNDPAANQLLAIILTDQARYDEARFFIERAIAQAPDFAPFHITLGTIRFNSGDLAGGTAALRRAVALNHRDPTGVSALAGALLHEGQATEAEAILRRAIAAGAPADHPAIAVTLARALLDTLRADEALAVVAQASRKAAPPDPELLSLACMLSNYASLEPAGAAELHRAYGRALAPPGPPPPVRDPDPERVLRVGILSPDLRAHAVAGFIEPFLRVRDPARVRPILFFTNPVADEATARLRDLVGEGDFHQIASPRAADIERTVRAGLPDILVELSGHTAGHNLPLLASRLAPIQVSYIGYPATTGVPAIDYRIVDAITDPPGSERLCTERLVRLPACFLCYRPPDDAPPPRVGSRLDPGRFTFGSFNNPAKISPETLNAWGAILRGVPASRLLLKARALDDQGVRSRVLTRLTARGVEAGRIDFLPFAASRVEHLTAYHHVDLALDTFPYGGTTTTCEALLMGVPVLTRRGRTHASRVGASLLHATGLGGSGLITETAEGYVARAVALAQDPATLGSVSTGLRPRLLASPLCDAVLHARALESALRDMWNDLIRPGPS